MDKGMVLPFTPLTMTFHDVHYFVDCPPVSQLGHPAVCPPFSGLPCHVANALSFLNVAFFCCSSARCMMPFSYTDNKMMLCRVIT